jgi:peptide/nickel transport system permease protein
VKHNSQENPINGGENHAKRKRISPNRLVWIRFKKSKTAVFGLIMISLLILVAIFADFIAPYDYAEQDFKNRFLYPSLEHPMGTDDFGRDLFSRVIYGSRISLVVALISVTLSLTIGGLLGSTAAFIGGGYESFVMRIMDAIMAIPSLLYAISISSVLGPGIFPTAISISFGTIPIFARVSRASVITVTTEEYIEAAKAVGARRGRLLFKHILPNAMAPIFVQVAMSSVMAILTISYLSFIGLGIQPPTPEWGSILSSGREYIRDFWPIIIFPGVMIMITLLSLNMMGDGLRDALDPRLKQ